MPHIDLLELPYFEGISMDELVSLVDLMRPVQFQAGDVIVREGGESPQALFIATSGRILIEKRGRDGADRSLAELSAPTLFGEIELFCQIPPVCTSKAVSKVAAFTLGRPAFDELFAKGHPALLRFTFNVARVACHRLAIADEMLAQVLTGDDLIKLRQAVFARMDPDDRAGRTTGSFRRPG